MKHSDLEVGMKVKRVEEFSDIFHTTTEGNISIVKDIYGYYFSTVEDDRLWEAQYFEPVEKIKE